MWSPWSIRSPSRAQQPKPKHSKAKTFSCSSFKDIQTLLQDEPSEPEPDSDFGNLTPRRASILHRLWTLHRHRAGQTRPDPEPPSLPDSAHRVVIFYTSLRVVRRTFEDCRAVRSILRSFRVQIDERDVSIDSHSLGELQRIIAAAAAPSLPAVFVGGRFVGGADEIRRLHESGELASLLHRLPKAEPAPRRGCDACGGLRFVVCDECDGSHKVYMDKCGFRACVGCNENGLIRCPSCSTVRSNSKHK